MISSAAILVLCATALGQGRPAVKWEAPKTPFIEGTPFVVRVSIQAPKEGAAVESWLLEPSAFTVNGKMLVERGESHAVMLAPGAKLTLDTDLAPALSNAPGFEKQSFKLGYGRGFVESEDVEVGYVQPVEKGLDFMTMPVEDLAKYHVVLRTNRGDMETEFWPDVAPNHVRNFLDLCYTGFYDGKTFHRVIPSFMIQGGDPTGTGAGDGPRLVKAEFSDRKHVAGVLSMGRKGDDINSASCQFFIMHGTSPDLDGKYSAFGKLVSGQDVVNKIATTARNQTTNKPNEPQLILKATVTKVAPK